MNINTVAFGLKFRYFSFCLRSEARVKSLSRYYALSILRAMIRKEKLAYSALGPRPGLSHCRILGIALTSGNDQE